MGSSCHTWLKPHLCHSVPWCLYSNFAHPGHRTKGGGVAPQPLKHDIDTIPSHADIPDDEAVLRGTHHCVLFSHQGASLHTTIGPSVNLNQIMDGTLEGTLVPHTWYPSPQSG